MVSLRVSSYVISIPLEGTNDQYMLIHGYTGAIDIATKELVSALQENREFTEDNSPFGREMLDSLRQRGYITDKSEEDEYAYTAHMADVLHRMRKALYKTFTWLITYNCNFRCPYCYEGDMSGNGENWSKKTFTKEMADRAFEAMLQIEPRRELHSKVITLYGGEPLLKENKEIVSYIVHKGKELGYSFIAITNGYDLDAYEDLISPDLIKKMQITIDGCKERHDARRRHYLYGESFDRIIENISIALRKGVEVVVRVNTDRIVFNDLDGLKRYFDELGYSEHENFTLASSLLYEDIQTDSSIPNVGQFLRLHKTVDYKFECQDFGLYHKLLDAISRNRYFSIKSVYCSAQTGSYILDPCGDIYPCLETVGKKDLVLGRYLSNGIEWTPLANKWHSRNISKSSKCRRCKYSFLCGGGCLGHKDSSYSFGETTCNGYAIALKYAANRAYHEFMKASHV